MALSGDQLRGAVHPRLVAVMVVVVLTAGIVAAIPTRAAEVADAPPPLPPVLPQVTIFPTTTTTTAPPHDEVLWRTEYDGNQDPANVVPPWQAEQEPSDRSGVVQNRIAVVRGSAVPGGEGRPSAVMRVELRPGDVQGSDANRAEVYARHAVPGSTAAADWPDPVGSTRWYGFSVYVPSDFAESSYWADVTQWKGYSGGSPPEAIEIAGSRFALGSSVASRADLGPLDKGSWTRFVVGIHFAADRTGWIEIWRDGTLVLPRTNRPTMGTRSDGTPDPTYLKQGLYRSTSWTTTNVVFHGPLSLGLTRGAVLTS